MDSRYLYRYRKDGTNVINVYDTGGGAFTFDELLDDVYKTARAAYQAAHKVAVVMGDTFPEEDREALLALSDLFEKAENHVGSLVSKGQWSCLPD